MFYIESPSALVLPRAKTSFCDLGYSFRSLANLMSPRMMREISANLAAVVFVRGFAELLDMLKDDSVIFGKLCIATQVQVHGAIKNNIIFLHQASLCLLGAQGLINVHSVRLHDSR